MKGQKQADGSWKLADGTTLAEAEYQAQLTDADKDIPPSNDGVPPWVTAIAQAQERDKLLAENAALRQREQERLEKERSILPSFQPGETFSEPNKFINVLNELVAKQIAPLREEGAALARDRAYNNLKKSVISRSPQFAAQFSAIEYLVDNEMASKEVTEANLIKSVQTVVGAIYLNNPAAFHTNNPSPTPTPKSPVPPNNIPPHLQASRSTIPQDGNNNSNEPSDDEFDENERRLMRERGLDKMQWKVLKNISPNKLGPKMWAAIKEKKWDVVKQLGGM